MGDRVVWRGDIAGTDEFLCGARLLLGVGEAATFPANAKATGYWFPVKERGLATAIFDASAKFAPAIGAPLIGYLMFNSGWRVSFAVTGILSLCYFALFYCFYRNPSEDKHLSIASGRLFAEGGARPEGAVRAAKGASLLYLVAAKEGHRRLHWLCLLQLHLLPAADLAAQLSVLGNAHRYAALGVLYRGTVALCDLRRAAGRGLAGGCAGTGRPKLDTGEAGGADRRNFPGAGNSGSGFLNYDGVALFWISVSIGGLSAAAAVGWSIPGLIAPRESVGSVGGIMNFVTQISAISAPIVTGYIVARTHSFAWAFAVAAIYLAIGVASYIFLLGDIEPVPEPSLQEV